MKTIIFYSVLFFFFACTNTKQAKKEPVSDGELKSLITVNFHVNGMTCTGCEKTITMGVKSIDGVKEVKASYMDSLAVVSFDSAKVTPALISQKISDLGYQVVSTFPLNKIN